MKHALEGLGEPEGKMQEWLQYVGLPVEHGIEKTFGVAPGPDLDRILTIYRTYPHAQNQHLIQPFPGITDLLRELKALDLPLALATSKRRLPLTKQLNAFGWADFFNPVVTPDEVSRGKPHPESLQFILDYWCCRPEEALMVGDTTFDLDMATAAGVPSLALGHGFHNQAQLSTCGPRAFAPDVRALRELLFAWIEP
jgi:phosphoglycolate phosphatase-like HAD superfamily hydrolase